MRLSFMNPSLYPEPFVWLVVIHVGLFGAIVGSFLNVCIHRLPKGYLSVVTPRSHCTSCGTLIRWYDNIPLLSWVLLGGACRHCKSVISVRYLLVELSTAALFVLYAYFIFLAPLSPFATLSESQRIVMASIALYLVGNMIVITLIDMAYRIIPDGITYTGIVIAPVLSVLCPFIHQPISFIPEPHLAGLFSSILGIAVGGGSLYMVGVIGKIVFRKEAMGLGDVKMMAMVGGIMGWDSALIIFLVACVAGTLFGTVSAIITRDRYTPFGPYLALGTLLTILFKSRISYLLFTLWPEIIARWLGMAPYSGF